MNLRMTRNKRELCEVLPRACCGAGCSACSMSQKVCLPVDLPLPV